MPIFAGPRVSADEHEVVEEDSPMGTNISKSWKRDSAHIEHLKVVERGEERESIDTDK